MIKEYVPANIRNVAIVGHGGTGKTTLTEALLFTSGVIKEMGSVEKGNTVSDYEEEEVSRKISIRTGVTHIIHKDKKINILDIPGSTDFIIDAHIAFRIADAVILIVDAEAGIEIGTSSLWGLAQEYNKPVLVFVNKMDKEHADFDKIMEELKEGFGKTIAPLQLPIGASSSFKGIVDLLTMKSQIPAEGGKKTEISDVPSELKSKAESLKEAMVEAVCEARDDLIEKFLDGQEISDEELQIAIRASLESGNVVPVVCGNTLTNAGVKALLDLIANSFPSPLIREEIKAKSSDGSEVIVKRDPKAPFSAFVFKTLIDQYAGRFSFFLVESGTLKINEEICNVRTLNTEKITHIYSMNGKNKTDQECIIAGDIGAFAKLEEAKTCDSLCNSSKKIQLPAFQIPSPIHFVSIRAENRKEEDKLNEQLMRIQEEDPSFKVEYNAETKETVISCMGDLQTNIALERIKKRGGVSATTDTPRVAYRETITKSVKAQYKHKKQTGGHGQYGEVHIEVIPMERGKGYEFEDAIVGGVIPKNYIPGVEKGVREFMESGALAGFPVTDIKVKLFYGSYHEVDSSEMAFKIAARQAMKSAMEQGNPVLLEPIMNVKVFVEESQMGAVMNDMNKRGRVLGMEKFRGTTQIVQAQVPLAEMLRYSIDLKAMTSGQATFEMTFSHYQEVMGKNAEKIISEAKALKEEG